MICEKCKGEIVAVYWRQTVPEVQDLCLGCGQEAEHVTPIWQGEARVLGGDGQCYVADYSPIDVAE